MRNYHTLDAHCELTLSDPAKSTKWNLDASFFKGFSPDFVVGTGAG